ncbi:SGNH hydrolase-type protein [Rhizobium phage RHph_X3_9]|nr:SGNH hydrolase-type protein [Rhizobium phage RHph_X3_9]
MTASAISNSNVRTIKRFIEYPAGTFHAVTWAGVPTVTINPGTVVKSDPIPGLVIPAGAKFWERTVNLNATVTNYPLVLLPTTSVALGIDDGNAAGDFGDNGTIAPSTTNRTFGAAAIVGDVAANDARAFVAMGDSLVYGEADTTGVSSKFGTGWVARMLDVHGYPYLKIAAGGMQATNGVTVRSTINVFLAQVGFTDFIMEYGVNDLRLGRTETQILQDRNTIKSETNINMKRIWYTTVTPRSDSTDGYATVANQTPKTDGNMSQLTSLNTTIRTKPDGIYGVIDTADAAMSARDSNVHKAPPAGTSDGTHFNTARCALIASLCAPQLALV